MSKNIKSIAIGLATSLITPITSFASNIKVNNNDMVLESSNLSRAVSSLDKAGVVTGVANNDHLNIRSSASSNSSVIGKYNNGSTVIITGKDGEWYQVDTNGKTGYVYEKYIRIVGNITYKKTTTNLNMRWASNTSSGIITTIPKGTTVKVVSTNNEWDKVYYAGKIGFSSNDYLTTTTSSSSSSSSSSINKEGKVVGVASNDTLNVRSTTNTSGTILTKISNGTKVQVIEQDKSTSWYKIVVNGYTGYVSNRYITIVGNSNSPTTSNIKKVTTTNVNLRSGAGTNYSIITTVASGTVVEVINTSGTWSKVNVGGKTGYMSNSYLKDYSPNSPSTTPNPIYSKVKVVIDAGHGGTDPGAVGNGIREKNIVLSISKKVNSKLQSLGFKTVMTRSSDTYITLSNRYSIANNNNADLFVSVHANSASSTSAKGIETLYKGNKTLAQNIQDGMLNQTSATNRGVKYRSDLAVLNGTKMPAALVEVGFISNASEASKIATDSYQEKLAIGIVNGITKYTNNNINK